LSKLDLVSRVPGQYERQTFADIIRAICTQSNLHAEGRLAGRYQAQASVPVFAAAAVGDLVWDNNATVYASVAAGLGASYVRLGWICNVASPTNATWQELRLLTGSGSTIPAVSASPITNSLGSDVALNNTANYFDGPSVAQGTVGTWFVIGTVTLQDTGIASEFFCKLWDGTTVIASAATENYTNTAYTTVTLSGFIIAPVGNLRISVKDPDANDRENPIQ